MVNFRESGHPLFRGSSAFFRGGLKSKGGGRTSIHCNADPAAAELLLRSIIFVYQLTIYGAEADWCEELAQQIANHSSTRTGNLVPKVKNESESKVAPTDVSILTKSPLINVQARRNSVQQHRKNSKTFQKIFEWVKLEKTLVLFETFLCFVAVHDKQLAGLRCAGSCREYKSPRDDGGSEAKAWIRGGTKIGLVLEVKVTNHKERYGMEIKIDSRQNDGTQSWIVISRGNWCGATRRDETKGIIYTVFIFIFVDDHADQSMNGDGTTHPPSEELMTRPTESRSWRPNFYDMKVILEKLM